MKRRVMLVVGSTNRRCAMTNISAKRSLPSLLICARRLHPACGRGIKWLSRAQMNTRTFDTTSFILNRRVITNGFWFVIRSEWTTPRKFEHTFFSVKEVISNVSERFLTLRSSVQLVRNRGSFPRWRSMKRSGHIWRKNLSSAT
ncbi:unnamed protein product [Microthlaspi erraticum]|uniref:Uncharacterized protein n=1 Tax=Microthlaspi erraticum TaxID=1685480 RepID=A0A6D2J8L4_9BRAS|nr:unnamed protein product [Microthlaspi erraticum]